MKQRNSFKHQIEKAESEIRRKLADYPRQRRLGILPVPTQFENVVDAWINRNCYGSKKLPK